MTSLNPDATKTKSTHADENASLSSYVGVPNIEQLSRKLLRTREQLKVAVAQIVKLEEKDKVTQQRLNALELSMAIIKGKTEEGKQLSDNQSDNSKDSVDGTNCPTQTGGS